VIEKYNPGVQGRPALVRRFPKMQAPLRKGKKRETLGRAKGVKRTGRSLLFGLLLIGIVTTSSLFYTWERLLVEGMLSDNLLLENQLELLRSKAERLSCEVTRLEAIPRLELIARSRLGMNPMDWNAVIVIQNIGGESR
jgi:hypothetical protein